jgi:hypothetical protein
MEVSTNVSSSVSQGLISLKSRLPILLRPKGRNALSISSSLSSLGPLTLLDLITLLCPSAQRALHLRLPIVLWKEASRNGNKGKTQLKVVVERVKPTLHSRAERAVVHRQQCLGPSQLARLVSLSHPIAVEQTAQPATTSLCRTVRRAVLVTIRHMITRRKINLELTENARRASQRTSEAANLLTKLHTQLLSPYPLLLLLSHERNQVIKNHLSLLAPAETALQKYLKTLSGTPLCTQHPLTVGQPYPTGQVDGMLLRYRLSLNLMLSTCLAVSLCRNHSSRGCPNNPACKRDMCQRQSRIRRRR